MKSIILKIHVYLKICMYFLETLFNYFAEPIKRIFSPADDSYPKTGVQPYDGENYSKWG